MSDFKVASEDYGEAGEHSLRAYAKGLYRRPDDWFVSPMGYVDRPSTGVLERRWVLWVRDGAKKKPKRKKK